LNPGTEQFPRELTAQEKYLLFLVLPENKPGYKSYREKINELYVTGYGRFKNNNFILGKKETVPDLSVSSSPVFALGTIKIPDDEIDILINEETDNEIEFDLSPKHSEVIPENIQELKKWDYSNWNPGDKSPGDSGEVREVIISKEDYVLVFAPTHKKIWLHENVSGVNYLIPLTNFYNELMGYKRIRDAKEALNPGLLFQKLNEYSDNDLINAFVFYNKYMRRFLIDFSKYMVRPRKADKKSFKDLFRKGKN
jgi:hypothetical protein